MTNLNWNFASSNITIFIACSRWLTVPPNLDTRPLVVERRRPIGIKNFGDRRIGVVYGGRRPWLSDALERMNEHFGFLAVFTVTITDVMEGYPLPGDGALASGEGSCEHGRDEVSGRRFRQGQQNSLHGQTGWVGWGGVWWWDSADLRSGYGN